MSKLLNEYISYILEKSFTETDIPTHFYLVGRIDAAKSTLAQGYLDGVEGISDTPDIIYHWLFVRDFVLKMPAKEFVAKNKVTKVMYDNPDYLISNNMRALNRLYNSSDSNSMFAKMSYYLKKACKNQDLYFAFNHSPPHHVAEAYDKKKPKIRNVADFAKFFYDNMDADSRWSYYWEKSRLSNVSYEDVYSMVRDALVEMGASYADEGEWMIKNKHIEIPRGSTLYIKSLPYIERYEQLRKAKQKQWQGFDEERKKAFAEDGMADGYINPTPESVFMSPPFEDKYSFEGYQENLETLEFVKSLEGKYKIVWVDNSKYEKSRNVTGERIRNKQQRRSSNQ